MSACGCPILQELCAAKASPQSQPLDWRLYYPTESLEASSFEPTPQHKWPGEMRRLSGSLRNNSIHAWRLLARAVCILQGRATICLRPAGR